MTEDSGPRTPEPNAPPVAMARRSRRAPPVLKRVAQRIPPGLRHSQEFQSALVRITAWLVMAVFIALGGLQGHYAVNFTAYFWLFGVHFAVFAALIRDIVRRPALRPWRTRLAIVADLSAITLLIWLSGVLLAPFYLVYILLFLSQGTRYGRTNLTIASVGSVVAFGIVATVMGGWETHAFEVSFVMASLVVLPMYQNGLLRNLQESRRRAEIATEARGSFLATMSHELRTPLSGIIGTAGLLRQSTLDDDQRRCVESICASGDTLQILIGDILDFSRIDSGNLELHPGHFDLRRSVVEVCRNTGHDAFVRGVELVCCIDGRLPEQAYADRIRFEQILYNIVGNAVKFTPAGRVCVEVERSPPHANLGVEHIEVVIADTGIGIPRERLDSIFDSFWQADSRASREYGGTGLGTTIAYRLTSGMGGHIAADSEEGQGTTFRIRLPMLPGPARDHPPRPPDTLRGRTVLLYEYDPETRSALESVCRDAGMRVMACSGDEELHRLLAGRTRFDAVDVLLVADTPQGRDLPALAAHLCDRIGREPPTLYAGYGGRPADAGADVTPMLVKPWHPVELWNALAALLEPDAAAGEGNGAPGPSAGSPASRDDVRVLVLEDDHVNAGLSEKLLDGLGYDVTIARDGWTGLEWMARASFDLALVDLRMPGMDGVAFTRAVRARASGGRRLPVVALTADADEATRRRAREAGIDEVLFKPIDAGALEALVERLAVARSGTRVPAAVSDPEN